jgi:hypothetical protein
LVRPVAVLVAALGLLAASCDQSATRVSTLWTNVPEMGPYVEQFNASQREWQVLVEYREDPAAALAAPGRKADLIVGRNLTSSTVKDGMVPLDFLFDGGNLAKASFYKGILEAGQQGDHSKVLPLSFDLPILVFGPTAQKDLDGFSLDLDRVKLLGVQFDTATASKGHQRLAFSPRWGGFGITLLTLQGANFQEGFQGALTWDSAGLGSGLDLLQNWPSPGWDKVTDFQHKYLTSDPFPSLTSDRILFSPSTLAAFLSRPWQERRNLDFRYLTREGKLATTDSTVWAGIPTGSLTRGAAERFLAWFFQAETQVKLMVQSKLQDDRNFGLARGLSALVAPNDALVDTQPSLSGRIPTREQVRFWASLPVDWPTLKSTVVRPWLETPKATESSLRSALDKHRTQGTHG